ncbi:MAG: copper-binding protein, partial [Vitreimonas sp.]
SANFLIDSEANLSGVLARLNASRGPAEAADATHETSGRITAIDGQTLMIAHAPIASLNWPAMTMQFRLARPELGRGLAAGDAVTFRFRQVDGAYVIDDIRETRHAP